MKTIKLHIGGLVAIGFDSARNYMLTVSHSGLGVYDTNTLEMVFRNNSVIYPENGIIAGVGPVSGELITLNEKDYTNDTLSGVSPDGNIIFSYQDGILDLQKHK